jgi:2-polyprenyl-3-methyl-5-hydroxy-6-metoxy-1,4-benzoquinol methylase
MDRLKNAYHYLWSRGMFQFTIEILNRFLVPALGIRLTSTKVSRSSYKVARRTFGSTKVKLSHDGSYFHLNPMPKKDELDDYYLHQYWQERGGDNSIVNTRDLIHLSILDEHIPQMLIPGKTILNFGAGHGGISHLMWWKGLNVVNVEPSVMPESYQTRWQIFTSISQVPSNSVDIIYGSHSLEHVQDIDWVKREIERVLRAPGWMFWEVPNADAENGARKDAPHTYYFRKDFFSRWLTRITINEGFKTELEEGGKIDIPTSQASPSGQVLRALGTLE